MMDVARIILSLLEDGEEDTLDPSSCQCYNRLLLLFWFLGGWSFGGGRKRGRSGGDERHFTGRGKGVGAVAV